MKKYAVALTFIAAGIAAAAPGGGGGGQPVVDYPVITLSKNPAAVGDTVKVTFNVFTDLSYTTAVTCGQGFMGFEVSTDGGLTYTPGGQLPGGGPVGFTGSGVSADFDTTPYSAGTKIRFRGHYASSGSGCQYATVSPGLNSATIVLTIGPASCSAPLTIAVANASNVGDPAPGTSSQWKFRLTVTACGTAVANVVAQGGDNGWAPVSSYAADTGAISIKKSNNRNNVYLWNIGSLHDGQTATADFVVTGSIKNSPSECGGIKTINGPWSALYSIDYGGGILGPQTKTDYTDQVTLTVTCSQ